MHGFVGQFGVVFDPETIKVLTRAFDDAWEQVQASKAPYATADYALAGRTILAKYIINAASHGERDPRTLANGALWHLSRQKLNRTPPDNSLF
jgi:hypothetical protein